MINTQRMLCANQEMIRTVLPFLADEPPVLCDWLPWNHTFGGNHNFGIVLYNGGTLYIDDGKPTPAAFETTLRNLREIAATAYFNVPRGYEMLVPHLRADAGAARALLQPAEDAVLRRGGAAAAVRRRAPGAWPSTRAASAIPLVTGLGATESAPFALCAGRRATSAAAASACRRPASS